MRGTVVEEVVLPDVGGTGRPPGEPGGGEGGESRPGVPATPRRAYFTALSMGLVTILMFFMSLVSAFIVRKGLGGDWRPIELPKILYVNTLALILSSFAVERARRQLANQEVAAFRRWWGITTLLGLLFLAGQYFAWLQLRGAGVFLATNPSSSFFYLLTAAHGAHLTGGILALLYVWLRNWEGREARRSIAADVSSVYWHFMDGLWVFLLLLLNLGR